MKSYLQQLFSHAMSLYQQGDLKGAEISFNQLLRDHPDYPDALHMLGLVYAQQNQFDSAISHIERAIRGNPTNTIFQNNLGETYKRKRDDKNALVYFEKATKTDPNFAQGYFNQATIRKGLGEFSLAISLYKEAVARDPGYFQAYYNLGNLAQEMGNYKSAMTYYEKCLAINDKHELAHNNMGITLQYWDRSEEAIEQYNRSIEINPKFCEAHSNLAQQYEKQGDIEKARESYEHLINLKPNDDLLRFKLNTLCPIIFESNRAIDEYRNRIGSAITRFKSLHVHPKEVNTSAFATCSDLIYQGRNDLPLKQAMASLYQKEMPEIPVRDPNPKPHIGFVVTNGHEGVFIKCMRGLINHMPLDKYNISIVCSLPNGKKILEPVVDNPGVKFISINPRLDLATQTIVDAKFDFLHYWEIGTDSANYLLPFMRLARVQCTSWGWPTTSGIPNVDYFISSKHLETEESDGYYSEKLVRLNRLPVYYYKPPLPDAVKPLADFGLPADKHLYLCAQNLKKIHPDFDQLVSGILQKDPHAIVIFINDKQDNITQLLRNRLEYVMPELFARIVFLERMSEENYLSLLKQVNVALDTLHYGGGANTCYDAFVCGTPMITLKGKFHRSRFGYAAYKQMELDDCFVASLEKYVDKAVEIGTNSRLRKDLSARIIKQSQVLFEDYTAVSELTDFIDSVTKN
ncbi:MAG: tetratricopeptide repeat protein [Cytophagales bacterium]|nr:tetratricopeptide repeat protein [Cytophagales bacterium]